MAPRRADIAVVSSSVEAIGRTVSSLLIHERASGETAVATLVVRKVLGPGVGAVESETVCKAVRYFHFQRTVVGAGPRTAAGNLGKVWKRRFRDDAGGITGRGR